MVLLDKLLPGMSQWQCTHYLPSHTYYGTYVPCSPYTHPEYCAYMSRHPPYSDLWQTNWLRQPSSFLVSSPLDISNFTFTLSLVLVDLRIHTYSVQLPRYLRISSSAWLVCLSKSLRASRVFCFISALFVLNTWLTAFMSLCLLPCQFCCSCSLQLSCVAASGPSSACCNARYQF